MEPVKARQRRPGDLIPAARHLEKKRPDHGNGPRDFGPHLGCEKGKLIPRQQIAGKAEGHRDTHQSDAREPRDFTRVAICLEQPHAKEVEEQREDHQVRRPRVDRADQPAELHLPHQKLDGLICLLGTGAVVEDQENTRGHLNQEKEECHPSQVVPDRMPVDRDLLLLRKLLQLREPDTLVEPLPEPATPCLHGFHAHALLFTTISSPRTFTTYCSSDRGGGPAMLSP